MPPIQTVYDNQIEVGWVGGTIVENLQTGEKILSSIKSYFLQPLWFSTICRVLTARINGWWIHIWEINGIHGGN